MTRSVLSLRDRLGWCRSRCWELAASRRVPSLRRRARPRGHRRSRAPSRSSISGPSGAEPRPVSPCWTVGSGRMVAGLHETLALNPASSTKLLTAAAALERLGPDYRYLTGLYGVLHGGVATDLVLRGHGNPSLQVRDLWELGSRARGARSPPRDRAHPGRPEPVRRRLHAAGLRPASRRVVELSRTGERRGARNATRSPCTCSRPKRGSRLPCGSIPRVS